MDHNEFSAQFDVLYNNVTSNQAPGLNEYEKSVFLTKAQNQLITEYFNNRTDGVGGGFDGSQKRQYDFSSLIKVSTLLNINEFSANVSQLDKLDKRSEVFYLPDDFFLAVNEMISDGVYQYSVIPLSYDEYQRLMMKPYSFPVKRAAWRLMTNKRFYTLYYKTNTSGKVILKLISPAYDSNFVIDDEDSIFILVNASNTPSSDFPSSLPALGMITGETNPCFCYEKDGQKYAIAASVSGHEGSIKLYSTTALSAHGRKAFDMLKYGFKLLKEKYYNKEEDSYGNAEYASNLIRLTRLLNGLQGVEYPSEYWDAHGTSFGFEFISNTNETTIVEIVGRFKGSLEYQMRYIKKPVPIILEDLSTMYGEDIHIDGYSDITECELPEECHQEILERAVTLAKIAWAGGTTTQAAAQQKNSNN